MTRTATTPARHVIGTGNQLKSDGTWNYTYDGEGNEIKKVNIQTGETWEYGYDQNNRMISAKQFASDGGALESMEAWTYDALGNRIEEDDWAQIGGTIVTRFAYDGTNAWGDFTQGNVLTVRGASTLTG